MSYALKIENLNKTYENSDFKLDNVSFEIPKGSIVGFVGKNGAGKSTTINTMLNLLNKDSGKIEILGEEMTDDSIDLRDKLGVVFDSTNFNSELTLTMLEKVFSSIYKNWNKQQFFDLVKRFDLPINKKIATFSHGMTMKVGLCVALSHDAKLLILDEATSGLDPVVREEILDIFLEYVENEENSILLSSHISSDLENVCDYIVFINNGKIVLKESKDVLIYEYGIARMKQSDFDNLDKSQYISHRKRGLQIEAIVKNKKEFTKENSQIVVDNATIDEILQIIIKGDV